jgi:hypothetical protein
LRVGVAGVVSIASMTKPLLSARSTWSSVEKLIVLVAGAYLPQIGRILLVLRDAFVYED